MPAPRLMPTPRFDEMLTAVARQLHGFASRLSEFSGLGPGQLAALNLIVKNPGLTHDMLRERLHLAPATVTRMVQRLESYGLVRRERRPRDRRTFALHPQPLAETIIHVNDAGEDLDVILTRGFSDDERALAALLLGRMAANLRDADAARDGTGRW